MHTPRTHARVRSLAMLALTLLASACTDDRLPAEPQLATTARFNAAPNNNEATVIATLRRVTARYHNQNAAFADGFVLLHPCENRPDEGPVGAVYVHFGRLLDGAIDPKLPDALIYEPMKDGSEKLVGVEFALLYSMWTDDEPPTFLGAEFQREDEFGVFALHAWVWKDNPEGMFAESNPRVTCGS